MRFQMMQQTAMRALAAGFVLSTMTSMTSVAAAQAIIRGVLYDDARGTPVRGTVMLVDPATDAAVVHVTADSLGQFSIQAGKGVYQLAAVRPGYTSVLSAPIPLANGERLTIRVPIAETGDPQHHIGVTEHVRPDPEADRALSAMKRIAEVGGFETRRALGTGLHYDRKDIERSPAHTLGEFLQNVPGLRVADPNAVGSMAMSRNSSMLLGNTSGNASLSCHVGWFVDGHRMDLPGRTDGMTEGLGGMSVEA